VGHGPTELEWTAGQGPPFIDPALASVVLNKKAVFLTADKFEDMEVFFPLFRLLELGWQVDIAAPSGKEINGEHGYTLEPTVTIDQVNPGDYGLLVIPGGLPDGAPATVRKNKKAQEITRSFFADGKPVASICHGPWTLAAADVVKGRRLTSYWHDGVPEDVKAAGGKWEDKEVVVDGNLITSRWPMDLPAFMREISRKVNSPD
jgi:archaeal arginyl aminopeptidase